MSCQLEGLSCKARQLQPEISARSERGPRLMSALLWGMVFPSFHTSAKGLWKVVSITHQQELVHLQIFNKKANLRDFGLSAFSKIGVLGLCLAAVSTVQGQLGPLLLTCEGLCHPCLGSGSAGSVQEILWARWTQKCGEKFSTERVWKAGAATAVVTCAVTRQNAMTFKLS